MRSLRRTSQGARRAAGPLPGERRSAQREGLPMTQLKAFIVEDSPVIRENLVAALEEMAPIDVVGTAEDETSALSWLARRRRTAAIWWWSTSS